MTAEESIYAALSGNAGVTALVGSRIYPDTIAEGQTGAAVVYARSETEPVITIGGTKLAERATIHLEAWADSREEAGAVIDACEAALLAAQIFPLNRASAYDPEVEAYAGVLDVVVWTYF